MNAQSFAHRDPAAVASAAGYAAWQPDEIMNCPYGSDSPLERLWWVRGWLARLGDEQDRAGSDQPA